MGQIPHSNVTVDRPPQQVLAVIRDISAYPHWDSAVAQAEVLARNDQGYPAQARFVLAQAGPISQYTLNYHWDLSPEGTGHISWHLAEIQGPLLAVDGSYQLSGTDSTLVQYQLSFELKGRLLGALAKQASGHIARSALQGLKRAVES